jgi:hypothetical protein
LKNYSETEAKGKKGPSKIGKLNSEIMVIIKRKRLIGN